jgi:hypothetical protein
MSAYDLYGATNADLISIRELLEASLGVAFEEREGGYEGGLYFFAGNEASEHFLLKNNLDPYDDEPAESKFAQHNVLLYVNDTHRADEISSVIAKAGGALSLLRHREL